MHSMVPTAYTWQCGPQWNLTFPASFLVSILFDSGERNMLSSLIPPNKSPCHHSFPMLLYKLPRIAVAASPHSAGVVPSSSPFLFPYFLGLTVSVSTHSISFSLMYMFVQSISRLPFRGTCACVCAHM